MKLIICAVLVFLAAGQASAQYRNYEVLPNGSGGSQGSYGGANFDLDGQSYGRPSGQYGGGRPDTQILRPSQTPGNVGATQRRCYYGENGNTFCE